VCERVISTPITLHTVKLPPLLEKFQEVLYSDEWRAVMTAITGIQTAPNATDMFAAVYGDGDHLLCHDDELSGRVLAYIFYLVPRDTQGDEKSSSSSSSSSSSARYSDMCKT
jgi:hypothetical protein